MKAHIEFVPAVLFPGEDGWVVAECPLIPGCISQGRDRTEALASVREAVAVSLECQEAEGWHLPSEYEVCDLPVRR